MANYSFINMSRQVILSRKSASYQTHDLSLVSYSYWWLLFLLMLCYMHNAVWSWMHLLPAIHLHEMATVMVSTISNTPCNMAESLQGHGVSGLRELVDGKVNVFSFEGADRLDRTYMWRQLVPGFGARYSKWAGAVSSRQSSWWWGRREWQIAASVCCKG